MTNNRVSMFRQAEVLRDPDHPKICARCQLVWKEYQPARDPHCHCFDHEYADFDREFGDFWRRKSDKEVAQLSEPLYPLHCCRWCRQPGEILFGIDDAFWIERCTNPDCVAFGDTVVDV